MSGVKWYFPFKSPMFFWNLMRPKVYGSRLAAAPGPWFENPLYSLSLEVHFSHVPDPRLTTNLPHDDQVRPQCGSFPPRVSPFGKAEKQGRILCTCPNIWTRKKRK
jgi:hypothetical protein